MEEIYRLYKSIWIDGIPCLEVKIVKHGILFHIETIFTDIWIDGSESNENEALEQIERIRTGKKG